MPSDRRVTTEPSGLVVLVDDIDPVPPVDEVALELLDEPAPLPWLSVVEEETFPPPAVTSVESPVAAPAEASLSMTVQRVPSSSVSVSAA